MKHLNASILALGLAAAVGTASAQSGYYPNSQPTVDRYGQSYGEQYDTARVIRVDPVIDSRSGYGSGNASNQNCYTRQDGYYAGSDSYNDGYNNGGYNNGGYNNGSTYGRNDGYYGNDTYRGSAGTQTGRTVATVVGGLLGAVVGSKVGGGSARYATSALGSMAGGMVGRQVYEASQRNRNPRQGNVTVCDPIPAGSNSGYYPTNNSYGTNSSYGNGGVRAYDVTYEYGGRRYNTRTNYHPGNTIRVRVDVRPE